MILSITPFYDAQQLVRYSLLTMVDQFGKAYIGSHIRKKRNIMAKQGKLLTKQGRKRKAN